MIAAPVNSLPDASAWRARYGDSVARITRQRPRTPPTSRGLPAPDPARRFPPQRPGERETPGRLAPQQPPTGPGPGHVVPGVASLALHGLLHGQPCRGRVVAVLPTAIYLDFGELAAKPRVIALSAPGAIRLPNAIALKLPAKDLTVAAANPGAHARPATVQAAGVRADDAWAGNGRVTACGMEVQVRRWWDPCPVFGPLSRARLEFGVAALARVYAAAEYRPGLDGHDGPASLAACCAAGDLAGAVEVAESLVGLGPGLTPSGDSMISGLLLALRLLGGATAGGTRPVWLADWLGAAVTCYAEQRTTPLAATLLHCAARGQAAEEVSAVLRGFAGQEPAEPAARRLLAAGRESGAELTWGLIAGCRAALALSVP
jgi:Protein of unknown function (DUF2877)